MATRVSLERLSRLLSPPALSSRIVWFVFIGVLVAAFAVGVALRGAAWGRWLSVNAELPEKVYIDAFDPWIEYWVARYLYEHGIGSWWSLHPPNPDVMKFWYPWGRDFTRTSYPLVPVLIAVTYPVGKALGFSFQQWAAWVPAIAGGFLAVMAGLLIARRFGPIPGMVAAFAVALLPASTDRTLLGFIEKEGISMPLVLLALYFNILLLEHLDEPLKRRVYSLAAGLAASLVGLTWGGYLLPIAVFILSMLLLPASRTQVRLEYVEAPILYYVGLLPAMLLSRWRGLDALLVEPGGVVLAAAIMLAVIHFLQGRVAGRRGGVAGIVRVVLENPLAYIIVFAIASFVVFVVAAEAGLLPSRVSYLLLPGYLKEIAVRKAGPLVESVAEHYPDIARLVHQATPAVLGLAVLGMLYMLYRVAFRGERGDLPLLVASVVAYYAAFNAAYFTQVGSVFAVLAAAATTGLMYESVGGGRGRRTAEYEVLLPAVGLLLAVVIVASVGFALAPRLHVYAYRLPMLLTSAVSVDKLDLAWYQALRYIRENTTPDTVVVSWWDYGYWISVFGDRPSVADGATINSTQISILARILVGDYRNAPMLLKLLHCKPGKTLIVAYNVYLMRKDPNTGMVTAAMQPTADLAKSYWMIRIGGLPLDEYMRRILIPTEHGFIEQYVFDPGRKGFQNGLLYRLLAQAPLMLAEKGVVKLMDTEVANLYANATGVVSSILMPTPNGWQPVTLTGSVLETPEGFKPYLVSAYTLGKTAGDWLVVVIVAAYEWVG